MTAMSAHTRGSPPTSAPIPSLQAELGAGGASMAAGYTWSIAAGRLRRLYGDSTSRALIEC